MPKLTEDEHKARHADLHRNLDELVADWIRHTGGMPSRSSVMELMVWSSKQMQDPATTPEDS